MVIGEIFMVFTESLIFMLSSMCTTHASLLVCEKEDLRCILPELIFYLMYHCLHIRFELQ